LPVFKLLEVGFNIDIDFPRIFFMLFIQLRFYLGSS